MKKIILMLISILFFVTNVSALENDLEVVKKEVEFIECVSATTSWIKVDGNVKRIKLLAYDSLDGNLNKEIEDYVCNILKSSKKVEIEYDLYSDVDKYNRELVWVYVDDKLLQKELINLGYGQVNFVTSDYKYLDELCETQKNAIINQLGVWNYDGIKESYCNSGVKIGSKNETLEEKIEEVKKYDTTKLYYLLFLNSGILLLLLVLKIKKRDMNG